MDFVIMDNDSGYVSHHNTESVSSLENFGGVAAPPGGPKSPFVLYQCEDALLEQPPLPSLNHSEDSVSVIDNSVESVSTQYSGFESGSDISSIIPVARPLVYNSSDGWGSFDADNSTMNSSTTSSMDLSFTSSITGIITTSPGDFVRPHSSTRSTRSPLKALRRQNKENIDPATPSKLAPANKPIVFESPDLFEDPGGDDTKPLVAPDLSIDLKQLAKAQANLSGVCPPPNLTLVHLTVDEMLDSYNLHGARLFVSPTDHGVPVNRPVDYRWPHVLNERTHGLHYNRSSVTEDFERLCTRYAERFIGAETQSTCTVFDMAPLSPSKRKCAKPKWMVKSPGRRLSHLARRRITFSSSSASSTTTGSGSARPMMMMMSSRARQILVDAKKLNTAGGSGSGGVVVRRRTPTKSPFKGATSSLSAKKRKFAVAFSQVAGGAENLMPSASFSVPTGAQSCKRTLFQSPTKNVSPVSSTRKLTKRALFSSPTSTRDGDKKRKRTDSEDSASNLSKMPRSLSSLSGFGLSSSQQSTTSDWHATLQRSNSATFALSTSSSSGQQLLPKSEELSDLHKKKLQWAVYESLRLQDVTSTHAQFKVFASVLARITRKLLPLSKAELRTTEKMFRIARSQAPAVVQGKSVNEIVGEFMRKNNIVVQSTDFVRATSASKEGVKVLQDKANIIESIEKRREYAGHKSKFVLEGRIDKIRKVISFDDENTS